MKAKKKTLTVWVGTEFLKNLKTQGAGIVYTYHSFVPNKPDREIKLILEVEDND